MKARDLAMSSIEDQCIIIPFDGVLMSLLAGSLCQEVLHRSYEDL
jgi:hypothetical protein